MRVVSKNVTENHDTLNKDLTSFMTKLSITSEFHNGKDPISLSLLQYHVNSYQFYSKL